MQIFEELGTFVVALALAVALLGVAAVMLYYFNPQQPVDHAKAAFYPLVKPLNATHVWLGVKPSADKVEVVELKYQYRGRWVDVPVARLTADRAVWLNATDGKPAAVPCFANVTVATRHGTASRAVSFTPACLQRAGVVDATEVFRQLSDYASYVANYLLYKSIPAITAYVKFEIGKPIYKRGNAMYVGIQNIAPFAFQAVFGASASNWQPWPPNYDAVNLLPLDARDIWRRGAAHPRYTAYLPWSVMYRWISLVVDWDNSTLRVWVNSALAYNGTPPAAAANFTSPQGFLITFTPIDADKANVTLYYEHYTGVSWYGFGSTAWSKAVSINGNTVSLNATKGDVSWWSGWVKMENVPVPTPVAFNNEFRIIRTIHVLPPAPHLGGNRTLFGAVTPFLVRSLTAMRASNGTVFASYAKEDGTVKTHKFNTPSGVFYVDELLRYQVPEGFKQVVYAFAGNTYVAALGFEYKRNGWEPFYYAVGDVSCGFHRGVSLNGEKYLVCESRDGRVEIDWYIRDNTVHLYRIYRYGDMKSLAYLRGTRLGQLSAALVWTPGDRMYAVSPVGIVFDTARVSIPFAYRWSLSGAYNYTLTLSMQFIPYYLDDGPNWTLYNITYVGKLELVYNGNLVAVDAFYGWYRELVTAPSGGGSASANAACVPTIIKTGEDQIHRDLNTGNNGYSVTVVNYATVRMAGCGADRTYTVPTYVSTITVDGTIYQVTDDKGDVCGFDRAYTGDDRVVRCR